MKKIYTKEEKAILVARGEARLGLKFFYTPVVVKTAIEHEVNCMCEPCFTVRLDRLVANSEKSLNDMKSSLSRRVAAAGVLIIDENPYTEPFAEAVLNVGTIPEYKGSR